MKEYILINRVPVTYSTDDAKSVTALWNALTSQWKTEGIFVSSFVFPSQGFVIREGENQVQRETVVSNELKIVSTIILRGPDYDEVIGRAKQSPILKQGGTVEVVEIMVR